ncbi:MAG: SpoIIE family protein phosphatase [Vicinamibacteria bacterium]|jgi:serine phosphatase RsbU (regulator of sigma subunit)|nr:SpoIIE family protein phosphatase [Vicinamibacteria bacterium]
MPEILIDSTDGARQRIKLEKPTTVIGRSKESDICFPDQWLSRRHAELRQRPDGMLLVDLASKNGTLLNGRRLAFEARLKPGDVISLGPYRLTFADDPPPALSDEGVMPSGTMIYPAREITSPEAVSKDQAALMRQNRVLTLLVQAYSELLEHRPLPVLFESILKLLLDAVPAERAAILLIEDGGAPIVIASRSRQGPPITRISRAIAGRVLQDRVSMILPNLLEDVAFNTQASILSAGIRSALCAPLLIDTPETGAESAIGLVYLDTRFTAYTFNEEDLHVVTSLANIAAANIEHTRLLEESTEKRRLEDDIRVAAEIQRSLLPERAPSLPGWEVVGSTRPCRMVGGDYFDFEIEGGRLLLALGDVSGKGTGAALLMSVLRAATRAHWALGTTAEAVAHINRTLCQNVPANKYITYFLAQLDPGQGRLSYVNAGHNPPLLMRANGELVRLEEGGMVLGLMDHAPYAQAEVALQAGDTLLVYSDGVSETWNSQDEEFGEGRLAELAIAMHTLAPAALQEEILRAIDGFSSGARATDDRTLVILKRL